MEFQNEVDVYEYITKIEQYIIDANGVPLSKSKVLIERDHLLYMIKVLKEELPKEVKACQRFWKEQQEKAEEILDKEAAGEVLTDIEHYIPSDLDNTLFETNSFILDEDKQREPVKFKAHSLIVEAEQKGEYIIQQAEEKAKTIIDQAREEGVRLVDEAEEQGRGIIHSALVNADNILEQAQKVFNKHIEVVNRDKEELDDILKKLAKDRNKLGKR